MHFTAQGSFTYTLPRLIEDMAANGLSHTCSQLSKHQSEQTQKTQTKKSIYYHLTSCVGGQNLLHRQQLQHNSSNRVPQSGTALFRAISPHQLHSGNGTLVLQNA